MLKLAFKGLFPKPVPLGEKAIGFLEEEIEAWIKERVDARDAKEALRTLQKKGGRLT